MSTAVILLTNSVTVSSNYQIIMQFQVHLIVIRQHPLFEVFYIGVRLKAF